MKRSPTQRVLAGTMVYDTHSLYRGGIYPLGTCSLGVEGVEVTEVADGVRGDGDEPAL